MVASKSVSIFRAYTTFVILWRRQMSIICKPCASRVKMMLPQVPLMQLLGPELNVIGIIETMKVIQNETKIPCLS